MYTLGILITLAAAAIFLGMGTLALFGAVDAHKNELQRTFQAEQPSPTNRLIAQASLWVPVFVVVLFTVLTGVQLVLVVLRAT
jgi:hypothetical protein